jgi:hypothetical protein
MRNVLATQFFTTKGDGRIFRWLLNKCSSFVSLEDKRSIQALLNVHPCSQLNCLGCFIASIASQHEAEIFFLNSFCYWLQAELPRSRSYIILFILTANGFLLCGSGYTIRHNKQITYSYITQNNTTIKRNTAHKTTHTIKDTLHRMNTNNHNYNYIN